MGLTWCILMMNLAVMFCLVILLRYVACADRLPYRDDPPGSIPRSRSIPLNPYTGGTHYIKGDYYSHVDEFYEEHEEHPDRDLCKCVCNYSKSEESRCEWKLIFKAVAGSGRSVISDYNNGGDMNQDIPEALDIESPLPYRNRDIVNDWNRLYIQQVKMEVWTDGFRKTWFLFDGIGSSPVSWLASSRLIASPYTDLKEGSFQYFSLVGDYYLDRTFFVERSYDGDCDHCGYIMVVEGSYCRYEDLVRRPYFLYGRRTDQCSRHEDSGETGVGNRLVISVKVCDFDP